MKEGKFVVRRNEGHNSILKKKKRGERERPSTVTERNPQGNI